ncbi:fibronectin type III domain-containing protein [Paenibacillus eucommiae]|uniref:Dockerin domain-containing protein n=1 Tax=Paenibacillus eucommiae TaxID=1355755 RepID=A0ABS4J024_9BACL|nr:fibronectin type III domain-containing protein [Paenibacillus eucommiae]MBP1992456.1 hypothetical protein [Paenibacillus eucommiae]
MRKKRTGLCTLLITFLVSIAAISFSFANAAHAATDDEFQIGAFFMPTWPYTNAAQYDYLKDAHVNLIQSFYPNDTQFKTIEHMKTALDLAEARGITIQVSDERSGFLMNSATNQDIDAIASTYKDHPATSGYYIIDEPGMAALSRAAYVYKRFLYNDPDSQSNVNLFPSNGVPGTTYTTYLKTWVNEVDARNLKYLTMDRYPFVGTGTAIDGNFYLDMRDLRTIGLQTHVKTALYLQSVGLGNDLRRPNANELRWHMYNSLAYGVKGVYWFTWFQPNIPGFDFKPAIIDKTGNKTDLYAPASQLGAEVTALGPTLMGLTSLNVYVNGSVPAGTVAIPPDYFWKPSTNDNLLISHFANAQGRNYIMVVNRDHINSKTLSFTLPAKPVTITEVSKETGSEESTNYSSTTGEVSATFLPGEGKLYALPAGFELQPSADVNDTDTTIIYTGSWSLQSKNAQKEDAHYTTTSGASMEYTFTGTGIELIGETGQSGGEVEVYLDNKLEATVSTYADAATKQQQVLFQKNNLTRGTHTIKVVKKTGGSLYFDMLRVEIGSGPIISVPTVPKSLTADHSDPSQIALTWSGQGSNIDAYNVYRAENATGVYTRLNTNPLTEPAFTDSALVADTTYYYKVTAANGVGESKFSPIVTVTTADDLPAKLEPVLNQLHLKNIYRSGSLQTDLTPLPEGYFWKPASTTDNMRISHYTSNEGRSYVLVVNRDYANSKTVTFNLNDKPNNVTEISKETGKQISTSYNSSSGQLSAAFQPGEQRLYALSTDFTETSIALINDTDTSISYTNWFSSHPYPRNIGDYMDDIHYTTAQGAYFEYTFTGTGIDLVFETDRNGGTMEVYIDDLLDKTVNTYENVVSKVMQTVYQRNDLEYGTHKVKVLKTSSSATYLFFDMIRVKNKQALTITLPDLPQNLAEVTKNAQEITIGWTSEEPNSVDSYHVYRSSTEGGSYTKLNDAPVIGNTYTDSGLSPDTNYYYKLKSVNVIGQSDYSNAINVRTNSDAPATSLTTQASSVSGGEMFKVKYGLGVVTARVYAQDIFLTYDPAVVEFISAVSIKDGVSLLETVTSPVGSIQLILASTGAGNEITAQAEIVELTFRAKHVSRAATSEIKVSSATLADGQGIEYAAALSSINVQVISGFPGDVNHDNKVTIGDLAIVAANYGKDTSSPDWEQIKQADLNGDGKIDIEDLVIIARKIIK